MMSTAAPPEVDGTEPGGQPPEPFGWTRRQRAALGVLLTLLLGFLAYQAAQRPARLGEPMPAGNADFHLARTLDPNTAALEDLTRVPYLGPRLAAALVAYRDSHPASALPLFGTADDLSRIPGFNKAVVTQIAPYLDFPDPPASEPAP